MKTGLCSFRRCILALGEVASTVAEDTAAGRIEHWRTMVEGCMLRLSADMFRPCKDVSLPQTPLLSKILLAVDTSGCSEGRRLAVGRFAEDWLGTIVVDIGDPSDRCLEEVREVPSSPLVEHHESSGCCFVDLSDELLAI